MILRVTVPAEYRAQRKLNEARIPEICGYILSNRDSYVFSALAASVDGDMKFVNVVGKGQATVASFIDNIINEHFAIHAAEIKAAFDEGLKAYRL